MRGSHIRDGIFRSLYLKERSWIKRIAVQGVPRQFDKTDGITYLLRLTVTNQIAFDQRDTKSIFNLERAMDRCCQALVSHFFFVFKLETLDTISFN